MNADHTTEALVVGGVNVGDADRVVHLLTESGRQAVYAHGARKSRRRFGGSLEPFTSVRASLGRRRQGSMGTLVSVLSLKTRLGLRDDLLKIAMASYFAELSYAVAPEGGPAHDVYALLLGHLDHLLETEATLALRRAFEFRLLGALGYAPELRFCVRCREVPSAPLFDLGLGGVLCSRHGAGAPRVGPKSLEWLSGVVGEGSLGASEGLGPADSHRAARALTRICSVFYTELLGRPPKSLKLLTQLEL